VPNNFISQPDLVKLSQRLSARSRLYAPILDFNDLHLTLITAENADKIVFDRHNTVEPAKGLVFKVSEKVSDYFGPQEDLKNDQEVVLLGVKACDVNALRIEDRVFLEGEFKDPFYQKNREKLTVISVDCSDFKNTCFCTLAGYKPYAEKDFDLNLSKLSDGYLVEVGSQKGEKIIAANRELFKDAPSAAEGERQRNRQQLTRELELQNDKFETRASLHEIHRLNDDPKSQAFKQITRNCVECLGCNKICPTCTCFLLVDNAVPAETKEHYERFKIWDSCLQNTYARVAGGANPRNKLFERLQNRYNCKFNYSYERLGVYTCVGCGRCIDCCMAKIDMREAFKEQGKEIVRMAVLK